MSWFLTNLISAFLLPPLNLLILAIVGLLFWNKRPRFARTTLTTSIALLWLLSTPYFAHILLHRLMDKTYAVNTRNAPADAIVVLGGGAYLNAPEYGGDTVNSASLLRLRYGAKLHRETGKPILITGGKPLGNAISEAELMKQVLEQEFNTPVRWTENASNNTLENAKLSFSILKAEGISRIYLVTHAWHMPRSILAFQSVGFTVVPAPINFPSSAKSSLLEFIPSASGLHMSRTFMHEEIGKLWYRLKS